MGATLSRLLCAFLLIYLRCKSRAPCVTFVPLCSQWTTSASSSSPLHMYPG
ncbi:unnamed protein product [Amoebophrya sp. A25]|nr:unnamed protein product [Amoebophrya sp. A25]|eukprot:GSA25T00027896001.1